MNIRAIKTADAINAVNSIKMMTKKEVKDVSLEIPNVFLEKRNYMQSDEFLKDSHNAKMFSIIDDMMIARDNIKNEISEINKTAKEKLVQAINGFKRYKKDIKKDNMLNFEDIPEFNSVNDNDYRILRNILLFSESRNV